MAHAEFEGAGLFPGGVGVTRLRVYTAPGADGLRGGSPHLHTVCSEGYLVTGGHGRVQTLTLQGGFIETGLRPGTLLWFDPGTIHRLVNDDALELVVIMQNSGLPEAGDAVLTFPSTDLASRAAYEAAARLSPPGGVPSLDGALARRDRALAGFSALREAALAGDLGPLRAFHERASHLVAALTPAWRQRWKGGAWSAALATERQLDAIAAADTRHFGGAGVHGAEADERFGMCGWLSAYPHT
ncbi:cupin domain-containing protein [Agromyces sp. NPDC056965]|uniref:cupin domain-containing protein n=1 Tax=Agromyces sp. NPDC056965 TaxID=3345983 RepID=UPI00364092B7